MICYLLWLFCATVIDAAHFDGGSIRWMPINPYDNSSSVAITIIQSYSWTYPTISCTTNVPISTAGRSSQNTNLTCVTDCSTDGGYSTAPINILTDCTSVSVSLGMLTSQRAANITLMSNAHFYLAFTGAAWVALNAPAQSGLEWSIVSFIDLRMRSDGFINTSPIASVASPQYAIVNTTTQIRIPVSDVNTGDDVRCRWSKYTPGYRRRKRSKTEEHAHYGNSVQIYEKMNANQEVIYSRKKRGHAKNCANCTSTCALNCLCSCAGCTGTVCSGNKCSYTPFCAVGTTTVETPGTVKSTSSYPSRQAIDECGGICYPSAVPYGTTLSNCTISFIGLVADTWYAVAIQVEDFINKTSITPLSSVPVQFLIYVMSEPVCSDAPVIIPLQGCLDVTVGVFMSFNLSVLNMCDPTDISLTDIFLSTQLDGMEGDSLTSSSTNASLAYMTFTWTPQTNQLGAQQMCAIAYTSEFVQSIEYCVTFNVITSVNLCPTTTTSTTTTFISVIPSVSSTTPTNAVSIAGTSTVTTTATTNDTSGKDLFWGLIAGLSTLGLVLLLVLCCCCCLYWSSWSSAAKRRRQEEANEEPYGYLHSNTDNTSRPTSNTIKVFQIEIPKNSYQVYDIPRKANNTKTSYMIIKNAANTSATPKWPISHVPIADQNWPVQRSPVAVQTNAEN